MKAVYNVIRERKILEALDHPLICNMRFAFQDTHSLFMAMDLMYEDIIQFWISELVCAVKYLHSQGIVHRDIKPDNILMDQEGHIHLSDFNIASQIHSNKPLTSLSGTAAYFAPEMFKGNGYNEDIDWWCVGVTFYECVYKKRPWPHCNSMDELKQYIVCKPIPYPPSKNASFNCISALKNFLERDPKKRLGHGITSGWHKIMSHPFFKPIDWYSLDSKQCTPLYKPPTTNDITHIVTQLTNDHDDSDDGVLGWWLYKKKRRASDTQQNRRKSQDLKLLEEKFRVFDYTVFDEYEGFLDEKRMTVGPPPPWVKPAFPGADNGKLLPVQEIYLEHNTVLDVFGEQDKTYFEFPLQNSIYSRGDTIQFLANDISHDDDVTVRISLHEASDDSLVKVLGDFTGKQISTGGDDFAFTWLADVPDGQYYVEAKELEEEDEDDDDDDEDSDDEDDDDSDDDDDEEDSNRSFNFEINTRPYNVPMHIQYQIRRFRVASWSQNKV
ncbi:hypothetical protein G6F43_008203 [Rhizopus delemar]|nr:hypothetical protein G6F43_008203 [Rhizopus delemar]